jgi:hypothetical protein
MTGKGFSLAIRDLPSRSTKRRYFLMNCEQQFYCSKPLQGDEFWTKIPEHATKYKTSTSAELAISEASSRMFCCSPQVVEMQHTVYRN